MEQHTKELYERLQTLTILRPLLQEPLLQSFSTMMESMLSLAEGNKTALSAAVSAYCDFTSEIYRCYAENEREISGNFSCGLYGLLFRTETDYLKAKARKKEFSPFLVPSDGRRSTKIFAGCGIHTPSAPLGNIRPGFPRRLP